MMYKQIENGIRDEIIKYYNENNISYTLKKYHNVHLLMIDYFEILRKRIEPRKRIIFVSTELEQKSKSAEFKEWLPRFNELKGWFAEGRDMNAFLSKRHRDSNFRDRLLTCWKIHHIHFFPEKKSGDMLLFAVVTENTVYMVDAIPHNKKYVFSTYNLLNIIYDNWRFLYEPFRIKDAVSVLEKITNDKDIQALRNAGACSFIEIRGKVYCLDMMATSGHSAFDVALANRVCNTIRKNEAILKVCKIEKIFLTGYHKPCFGVVCKDQSSGMLIPLILGK